MTTTIFSSYLPDISDIPFYSHHVESFPGRIARQEKEMIIDVFDQLIAIITPLKHITDDLIIPFTVTNKSSYEGQYHIFEKDMKTLITERFNAFGYPTIKISKVLNIDADNKYQITFV